MRAAQFRVLDGVALILALGMVAVAGLAARSTGEAELVVIRSIEGRFLYPLDQDREIILAGPLGTTTVEIAGGQVRVAEDPGPLQICVQQGWIGSNGQWLACLPSRIFIEVTGPVNSDVDAQTF
jgi:hypothetical protein